MLCVGCLVVGCLFVCCCLFCLFVYCCFFSFSPHLLTFSLLSSLTLSLCSTHSNTNTNKQDKSGGVDKEEFVVWFSKGSLLQPEQRKIFSEGGTVQKPILLFLEAIETCLTAPAPSRSSGRSDGGGGGGGNDDDGTYTTTNAVSDVVKNLFQTFDIDQDGHIE